MPITVFSWSHWLYYIYYINIKPRSKSWIKVSSIVNTHFVQHDHYKDWVGHYWNTDIITKRIVKYWYMYYVCVYKLDVSQRFINSFCIQPNRDGLSKKTYMWDMIIPVNSSIASLTTSKLCWWYMYLIKCKNVLTASGMSLSGIVRKHAYTYCIIWPFSIHGPLPQV